MFSVQFDRKHDIFIHIENRNKIIILEYKQPGDVIILAGKGHETYQEIKGVKHDMDERVLIREILEELDVR